MEYQRSLIADFAYVYQAFHKASSMGEALRHIFAGKRTFRPRSIARCGQIAAIIYGEREVIRFSDATSFLELYLQLLLEQTFWRSVTPLPDPIQCDLIEIGTTRQSDGIFKVANACRKESAACALPHFLAKQQLRLSAIADYLVEHPNVLKNQDKVEQLMTAVIEDPYVALGQMACWPLGDIIIALQVPSGYSIWTLDTDFKALATALELPLYTPY